MVNSMSEAVKEWLEKLPMDTEFTGMQLENAVHRIYPPSKYNFGHTIDRRLREWREGEGFYILCIDPVKSRYKKVKPDLRRKLKKRA